MTQSEPHDPKGKTRLSLRPGVRGDAMFGGVNDCYRLWLTRDWSTDEHKPITESPFLLSIGMNPSTAAGDVDDPTIRLEMGLARRLGLERYVKCNAMAYRATFPRDLLTAQHEVCPLANLSTISAFAMHATRIIVTWGKLHPRLRVHGDAVLFRLAGRELWCIGKNLDGSPKHPLRYLTAETPLERYR